MKYAKKLGVKGTVGICAPSMGLKNGILNEMLKRAIEKYELLGHNVILTENVFNNINGRSSTAELRKNEFMELWNNNEVDIIISASGGDYMMEILDYIDFEELKHNTPKLFQGCSDNTILTFLLTIICDIATVYGKNFYEFGIENWHSTIHDNYKFLIGENNLVKSVKWVEEKDLMWNATEPLKEYNCNYDNKWICKTNDNFKITGRIIGGCLDNLTTICGTKFDKVQQFNNKYKKDGIIWYFDSCELDETSQVRSLWQLKNAGWFSNTNLIIFGRPVKHQKTYDLDYRDNLFEILKDLNIPIIFDCNIGHIQPTFYIYNGSICEVIYKDGSGSIEYFEK